MLCQSCMGSSRTWVHIELPTLDLYEEGMSVCELILFGRLPMQYGDGSKYESIKPSESDRGPKYLRVVGISALGPGLRPCWGQVRGHLPWAWGSLPWPCLVLICSSCIKVEMESNRISRRQQIDGKEGKGMLQNMQAMQKNCTAFKPQCTFGVSSCNNHFHSQQMAKKNQRKDPGCPFESFESSNDKDMRSTQISLELNPHPSRKAEI